MVGMHRSRSYRGFTLIELLVVVSIIALLISILLPGLKGARDQAKRVACQSNMRNCNTSLITYVSEFDSYPVLFKNVNGAVSWATWSFGGWMGKDFKTFCNSQGLGTFCFPVSQRPLSIYMMAPQDVSPDHPGQDNVYGTYDDRVTAMPVFQCPSDTLSTQWQWQPGAKLVDMTAYDQCGSSYQMNFYWFYQAEARAKKELVGFVPAAKLWGKAFEIGKRVWRSADEQGGASRFVTMVEDPFDWGIAQGLSSAANANADGNYKPPTWGVQMMGFHGKWSRHMMAFLDGHVEYLNANTRYQREQLWSVTNEKWLDTRRFENDK